MKTKIHIRGNPTKEDKKQINKIVAQAEERAKKKWLGDNPCADCGTKENIVWFTDSSFWNKVMGEEKGKILCVKCFVKRAEQKHDLTSPPKEITGWELTPEWSEIPISKTYKI